MADVPFVATIHAGLSGFIAGCIPSNPSGGGSDPTNDMVFSVGRAFDGTRGYATAALTKRADAGWALGTAAGGMASVAGTPITFAATTDFHWFLLLNPITGETDYGCDTSVIAANLLTTAAASAAGFTVALRATSLRTGAGAAWPTFKAREIALGAVKYLVKVPAFESGSSKNWSGADDAAQTATLALVPGGIQVTAIFGAVFQDTSASAASAILFTSLDQDDTAPSATAASHMGSLKLVPNGGGNSAASGEFQIETSTGRQFRYRGAGTTADHELGVNTQGWIDSRN
jgi:hypothetical protein